MPSCWSRASTHACPRRGRAGRSCSSLIVGASVAAPLALRGRGSPPVLEARPIDAAVERRRSERTARVTVIALDAASLDFITRATAEGRLPNFGRILDAGAVRHLATLHPTSAEAVWAAVATGKLPQKNGVRSAACIGSPRRRRAAATAARTTASRTAWCGFGFLAGAAAHVGDVPNANAVEHPQRRKGFSVGVVGWPLTQPAPAVRGYLVSDTYHRLALTPSGIDDPSSVYPPELQPDALAAMEARGAEVPPVVNATLVDEDGRPRRHGPIASTIASRRRWRGRVRRR